MKKSPTLLYCFLPYLAMLVIRTFGAGLLGPLFFKSVSTVDYATYVIDVFSLINLLYIVLFGGWYYIAFVRKNNKDNENREKSSFWSIRNVCLLILLSVLMQIAVSYALTFILGLFPETAKSYDSILSPLLSMSPLAVIYVCVLSPIGEECIFRGLILGYARNHVLFYIANMLQAALFGVFHGNIVQGVYAFLIGMLMGYIVWLTGTVVGSMIFHAALNMAGLYLEKLLPESLPSGVKIALMVVAACICVLIVFVWKREDTLVRNIGQS